MKKGLIIIIILVLLGIGTSFVLGHNAGVSPSLKIQPRNPLSQSTPTQPPVSPTVALIPARLQIPAIGVDAAVEQVGMDSQGRMDVPKKSADVAWYDLGYKPGQSGNAAFAGHLDNVYGQPAVFWNLSKLTPGDKIIVSDANGNQLTFVVTQATNYPWDNFPLQEVFGAYAKPRVNLITCEGVWNKATHNYSRRTVVYSELAQSQ